MPKGREDMISIVRRLKKNGATGLAAMAWQPTGGGSSAPLVRKDSAVVEDPRPSCGHLRSRPP